MRCSPPWSRPSPSKASDRLRRHRGNWQLELAEKSGAAMVQGFVLARPELAPTSFSASKRACAARAPSAARPGPWRADCPARASASCAIRKPSDAGSSRYERGCGHGRSGSTTRSSSTRSASRAAATASTGCEASISRSSSAGARCCRRSRSKERSRHTSPGRRRLRNVPGCRCRRRIAISSSAWAWRCHCATIATSASTRLNSSSAPRAAIRKH